MPTDLLEHAGVTYAVLTFYALPDDAWYVELSESVPAPPAWAAAPQAAARVPGRTLLLAVVPDEDPAREPSVELVGEEHTIPYEVLRWYLSFVDREVESARKALASR